MQELESLALPDGRQDQRAFNQRELVPELSRTVFTSG
jgi:hypothetical protein